MGTYNREPDLDEMAAVIEVLRERGCDFKNLPQIGCMMGSAYRPQQMYGGSAPTYAPAPSQPRQPTYVAVAKPYVLNSVAIWIWAFAPLLYVGIPWYLCILANCIFCAIDESGLKKAGYDSGGLYFWGFSLVPIYLWKRQKLVDGTIAPFVIWLVLFVLTLGV